MQTGGGPAGALPFIYGHVDPTLIPIEQIQVAAAEALRKHGASALNYGVEHGCGLLLDFLKEKFLRDECLQVSTDSLILTFGASGGLDAVCRLFTGPGDTVLVEAPTYHEALALIRDHPVQVAMVPIDDDGIIIEALDKQLREFSTRNIAPRLLYTIPSFQNPSGVTLSSERRPALLELARQYGFLIVEDDVYRDLAFEPSPPASLFALDVETQGRNVLRLGSFSKILAPGLRLGWLMGPPEIVSQLAGCGLSASGGGANPFSAFVTAVFCRNGWLEPHIAHLVEVYRYRRNVVLTTLQDSMSERVRWTRPTGGFYVWLTLPEHLKAHDVLERAHQHNVTFLTGEPFFAGDGGEHNIRLPYSFIPPAEMTDGVHTLARIIEEMV
jgi:DNA-binding transcriptional MocR family regulator